MYYGKKVKLRGLELSDVDNIMKYWNDFEMRENLYSQIPYSREEEEEWIRSTWKSRSQANGYVFAIETHDGEWLGTTGLHGVNQINRSADFGIAIHRKDLWGKGYGTDATITMCAIGFNILNLNRIELEYYEKNIKGEKAYTNAGFKEIGRRRQARLIDGKYEDSVLMDFLRDEFKEKYPDFSLYQTDK
jgi:RimJ/RimL family protein N-acetyltransferase